MKYFHALLSLLLLAGCAHNNTVVVGTGTVIGVEISENPATGLYQAKLGYNRGEVAFVPIPTNGLPPDVLTELRYAGIFARTGGIYQRMAVGATAVSQPGASMLFAKDSAGNISAEVANALSTIPQASVTPQRATQAELARRYMASQDRSSWDTAVKTLGYNTFLDFLKITNPTAAQVAAVVKAVTGL